MPKTHTEKIPEGDVVEINRQHFHDRMIKGVGGVLASASYTTENVVHQCTRATRKFFHGLFGRS